MELWIRSQDKEAIRKVNMGIMYWKDVNNRDCIVNIDNATGYSIMGAYKTKERALEVLDEIQNILKPIIYNEPITREITSPTDHYKKYECVEYLQTIQEMSTYVYQMPKE